ncbi:DNA replication/repair protein RecF [Breoghania sp.]|uniref:DNA replication/repair protein RecF n=1 Tax=Breoghania sp. TaxID=2065378 RepID=UPI002621D01D|nr:DNA replication/repair protein RecF [Breoghania sp.]MDJ0933624.1 DNA replication/repair protein RecF [Breoghania sp.]
MPDPVRLTRLSLTDFRNYTAATLDIEARLVALTGNNGAGKTNLLEAVSLLTPGRGLRRAAFADLVRKVDPQSLPPDGWSVAARLDGPVGETRIGIGFSSDTASRRIRIDAEDARTADELSQYLRVFWLVPSMDGLFTGPAGDRRRFLDRLVLAVDPGHGRRVADFEKAMRSRNRLLETGGEVAWLDAVEVQLASLGIAVAYARRETVTLLAGLLNDQGGSEPDTFPRAGLALEGPFEDLAATTPAADLEDTFAEVMARGRTRDRAAGRTLDGPHRTDLTVTHLAKQMPAGLASTGEQKALLIGLVLAHAELTARVSNMTPVLLLDEVATHLDPTRRAALFARLDVLGGQVFMTGTDVGLSEALPEGAQRFAVSDAMVHLIE